MPGTVPINENTFCDYIAQILAGFWNAGYRKVILLNGHGQEYVIPTAIHQFARKYQVPGVFMNVNWYYAVSYTHLDIVKYVVITSTLGSMGMYAHILIMTNVGPGDASRSVLYQMYYKAFLMGQFGEGSAIAVLFIIQCIIISILINRTIAKEKIEF